MKLPKLLRKYRQDQISQMNLRIPMTKLVYKAQMKKQNMDGIVIIHDLEFLSMTKMENC